MKGARQLLINPDLLRPDLNHLFIVVMAGGASSRFFPVNKIFSDLTGENRTMIQQAFDRATNPDDTGACPAFVPAERFFVVTGAEFASTMRQQLARVPPENILIDPARRNTLPAILWALSHIRHLDPDATVAILTADHVIRDVAIFQDTIARAAAVAEHARAVVAIGIRPNAGTKEWTGFGAIKSASSSSPNGSDIRRLLRFEEKPGELRAEEMIREGGWTWNAGMFLFQVTTFERAIAACQPGMFATYLAMSRAVAAGRTADAAAQFEAFPGKVPHPLHDGKEVDNSIDYAVMVPLTTDPKLSALVESYVIQGSFFWVDIGSWDALRKVVPADADGNVVVGDVRVVATRRSILVAERGRTIEAHGVEGLIVVHASNGTVMFAPEYRAQEVKQLFEAARTAPAGESVMLECVNCHVDAGAGRVVALGVSDLEVVHVGDGVRIRAIPRTDSPTSSITSPSPSPSLSRPVFMSRNPVELGFGTSGMRGLVTDMTDMEVYINACGFLQWLKEVRAHTGRSVAIAGDLRPSTDRIMRAIVRAIEDCGMIAEHHSRIPTPALAAYAISRNMPCLMVTGSHIPIDRNGIKFYREDGEVLKSDEAPIKAMVARRRQLEYAKTAFETGFTSDGAFKVDSRPLETPNPAALNEYLQRYLDAFPNQPLKGKIIVVYQHSAVGRDFLMQLMSSLGATVFAVNRSPDHEFVAIDTEDVRPEYLSLFRSFTMDYSNLFAIVSTDGDSDRPIVVDERGRFHRGDVLGILTAEFLDAKFAAVPVSASDAVDERLGTAGITHRKTRIGSPYVIEAMNMAISGGVRNVVGWEVNGGFLTGSEFMIDGNVLPSLATRDAMLPMLAALISAVKQRKPLSEVFDELPGRSTQAGLIDNFPLDEVAKPILQRFSLGDLGFQEVAFEDACVNLVKSDGSIEMIAASDPRALEFIAKRAEIERYFSRKHGFDEVRKINQIDGVKITFASGDTAHLRASSNAPQMRIYSVAATQDRADAIVRLGICEDLDDGEPLGILRRMERDILHPRGSLPPEEILRKPGEHIDSRVQRLLRLINDLATNLDFSSDNIQGESNTFDDEDYRAALGSRDAAVRTVLKELDPAMDLTTARELLAWLSANESFDVTTEQQASNAIRLLQYKALSAAPIQTELHGSHYAWAGDTLKRLFGTAERYSETWPFFSCRAGMGPAGIAGTAVTIHGREILAPVTMRDLVTRVPSVLGSVGADPGNDSQKYFFVKFLDPSDFPPAAYVGFNPVAVAQFGSPQAFKQRLVELLWNSRSAAGHLLLLVRPEEGGAVRDRERFAAFKLAYKEWAICQSQIGWATGPPPEGLLSGGRSAAEIANIVALFAATEKHEEVLKALQSQGAALQELTGFMHKFDFADGEALLIESPTFHGIFGLSIQSHPKQKGNFHPKDELWICKKIALPEGAPGWILVEPQRSFDKTESASDPFTPFEWEDRAGIRFRKREIMGGEITVRSLQQFVDMIDTTPRQSKHYVRRATPLDPLPSGWDVKGSARWFAVVDDSVQVGEAIFHAWPYFTVRELRFMEAGDGVMPLPSGQCFTELHATQGEIELSLVGEGDERVSISITPTQPVFLPASLPYRSATLHASSAADLLVFGKTVLK